MNNITLTVKPEEISRVITILQKESLPTNFVSCPDGSAVFSLELTDEALENLNGAILRYRLKSGTVALVKSGASALTTATEYAVKDVAVPAAKIGFNVGVTAARIAAEASVIAASSVVNVLTSEGARTAQNISGSSEYQQAKDSICGLGRKVSSLFGWKSGIQMTKL